MVARHILDIERRGGHLDIEQALYDVEAVSAAAAIYGDGRGSAGDAAFQRLDSIPGRGRGRGGCSVDQVEATPLRIICDAPGDLVGDGFAARPRAATAEDSNDGQQAGELQT